MKRNMICIGCPMGCELTVDVEDGKAAAVSGNNCGVGKKYAETEISAPTRIVTTTALTESGIPVPVKTCSGIPKDKIFDVIAAIKSVKITLPVSVGDVIIENVCETGAAVAVTKSCTQ
ncbi:MAG: DUF1667 domain-containing protein [Clostridia bacterium]|nr:DUF1667 domain-containing protein [Clostridia bacterium]